MCDYSLMTIPNRLAVSGEELVVHRFEAGSAGSSVAGSGSGSRLFFIFRVLNPSRQYASRPAPLAGTRDSGKAAA